MVFDNFDVTFEQIGPIHWEIQVITPDKNKFIGHAQLPGQQLNDEFAYHIWKNSNKQFFLELELKNEIVKV